MTKDIIRMAKEAGLFTHKEVQPEILAFANLVAAAEREACAKFLESTDLSTLPRAMMMHYAMIYKRIATDIRARGLT